MAYTINTGTMLSDKAGALMWESLRFESEPWTRFYKAGEVIRESRQASGKQRMYVNEGKTADSNRSD
jgi:hypothetical protein